MLLIRKGRGEGITTVSRAKYKRAGDVWVLRPFLRPFFWLAVEKGKKEIESTLSSPTQHAFISLAEHVK